MLSLWYLILGWKEYNKPFVKSEKPGAKPVDPPRKPDLIPQKPSVPGTDLRKPEPPKPVAPSAAKVPDVPKPSLPKDIPKVPDTQKMPELPKVPPKIPERPKMPSPPKVSPPKVPESVKGSPKTPDSPKPPETPKVPPKLTELPKVGSKGPDSPKIPELPKPAPKTPDSPKGPKVPERADVPGMMPSKRPESVMPTFPSSGRNPAAGPNQEFPLPPYLPGASNNQKPSSKGDELFGVGSNSRAQDSRKPLNDFRDLSYGRGELPEMLDSAAKKVQQNLSKVPKYMEESTVSNPDSLDSSEEEEDD